MDPLEQIRQSMERAKLMRLEEARGVSALEEARGPSAFQAKVMHDFSALFQVADALKTIGVQFNGSNKVLFSVEYEDQEKCFFVRFSTYLVAVVTTNQGNWCIGDLNIRGRSYDVRNVSQLVDHFVRAAMEEGNLEERFAAITEQSASGLSPAIENAISGLAPALARAAEHT